MVGDQLIFLIMVFLAVFLLATAIIVPTFGTSAQAAKNLRRRIQGTIETLDPAAISLLREKSFHKLSPLERWIEGLPGMARLSLLIKQSGRETAAYRVVLFAFGLGMGFGLLVWALSRSPLLGLLVAFVSFIFPILKIRIERDKRIGKFEEQLPEALDIMSRAMKAGYPFAETLHVASEEMRDPLAKEFRTTFADINYGMNIKIAFLSLLQRVPSMSLMAVVTGVLVQRDTGGNLAEILEKIAAVVRGRFRFQRKVRTFTAEGRISAWVLTLVPFVLSAALHVTNPEYLPMLIKEPLGRTLILLAFINIMVGVFWMRRIIRIDV
ncbi:type II secretion system F family protein [Nitrosococcus wardiae]|uniref:Secretion system protein n=1 Tax=Nitrosococcus wardiae TaxID=1814290 RepID=A0A4P7C4X7_9GAMM|nr:type II secretion system F family protein [Nitrosococcus wardiae]QBQ55872.1 secretion system protein [Nitrosococcus wardiae]